MLAGWYQLFVLGSRVSVSYHIKNRIIALFCLLLFIVIFVTFYQELPGFSDHPLAFMVFAAVELFLFMMLGLTDSYVFDLKNRRFRHTLGFLFFVRVKQYRFIEISNFEVTGVIREGFIDGLNDRGRRKPKKSYQLRIFTRDGMSVNLGLFRQKDLETIQRIKHSIEKE